MQLEKPSRTIYHIRPMNDEDDKAQIAKLIYLSDNYIYPSWFDSLADAQKVISQMIDMPTLYNKKNILVAVTDEGFIAGALVSCNCPFDEKEEHIREAFARAGVPCGHRTHEIYLAYYAKMDYPNGHYFANIAVDEKYRRQGIATALILHALEGKGYCHLECVQENAGAWQLYQRLGFDIVKEYLGVCDVPCYKMEKKEK